MTVKTYIRDILERSCLPKAERKKVKADLENELQDATRRGESVEQIVARMGDADEVAAGLYENYVDTPARPFREYKSKRMLLGLPLVHVIRGNYRAAVPAVRAVGGRVVNVGGRYGVSSLYGLPTARGIFAFGPKARGIVAVGNIATGIVSIGNLSLGVFSIGNVAAGLFTAGNLALAALIAFGNAAVGLLAAGNTACGYAAAGNAAYGAFAIGGKAGGAVALSVGNRAADLGRIHAFFASLDAPAPVRAFFGVIERVITLLADPATGTPLLLALLAGLVALILTVALVPNLLLPKSRETM